MENSATLRLSLAVVVAFFGTCSFSESVPVSCQGSCGTFEPVSLRSGYEMTFASSNYPDKYNNRMDCTWEFVAPEGKEVVVEFTRFEVRKPYYGTN